MSAPPMFFRVVDQVKVVKFKTKDDLADTMKRAIARQAEAERLSRADGEPRRAT